MRHYPLGVHRNDVPSFGAPLGVRFTFSVVWAFGRRIPWGGYAIWCCRLRGVLDRREATSRLSKLGFGSTSKSEIREQVLKDFEKLARVSRNLKSVGSCVGLRRPCVS